MDLYNDNYEEQIKQIRITTIATILDYRMPQVPLNFLYKLSLAQLDEIVDKIVTITEEELLDYQSKE